jgi:hypothetical protein
MEAASAELAARRRGLRPLAATLTSRIGVLGTLAVAGAVFGLAFNSGSYALTARCAIGVAVWWGLALALASGLLPLSRVPRVALVAAAFLGGLMLLSGLSVIWSASAETAFDEADRVLLYLGAFLLIALVATRASLPRWLDGIGLGVVAVTVLALIGRLFPHLIPGSDSSPFPNDPRATWPLDYWNGLAIFAALGVPSLLRSAVAGRYALGRAAAVAALPALAAVIYLTSSRGGAGTALIAVVAFIALTRQRGQAIVATLAGTLGAVGVVFTLAARSALVDNPFHDPAAIGQGHSAAWLIGAACLGSGLLYFLVSRLAVRLPRPSRRTLALAGAVVAAVVAAGIVASNPGDRLSHFRDPPPSGQTSSSYTSTHLTSAGGSGRYQFWSAAIDEFEAHPIVGDGAGSYPAWWLQHGSLRYFTRNAHSVYLQTLGELGIVGLLLLVAALATVAVAGVRRVRAGPAARTELAAVAALAVAFVAAAGYDWMWQIPAVTLLGICGLAMLVGPATEPGSGVTKFGLPRVRWPWRAILLIVGAAAAASQAIPLLSQSDIERSQRQAARLDYPAALASARDARDIQPWAASPRLQIALIQEDWGDLPAARREIRGAIERDPSNWQLWLLSARFAQEEGDRAAAASDLRHASRLNPRSPLIADFRRSLSPTRR